MPRLKLNQILLTLAPFIGGVTIHAGPIGLTISGPQPATFTHRIPVSAQLDISDVFGSDRERHLQLKSSTDSATRFLIPVQFEPDQPNSLRGTLRWLMPAQTLGATNWLLEASTTPAETPLRVQKDAVTGHWDISEAGHPVLRYNYMTNNPGEVLTKVKPDDRKYARARSDYIHPLYGLQGEELTKDWSPDHPHHRGIYWAWPEVEYQNQRGDLHALQRVFARPSGSCVAQAGPVYAQIEAENLWLWEDREPIVREKAVIRTWRADANGRFIDLEFQFLALKDDVTVARRETKLYGGLNIRLASVSDQQIKPHTEPGDVAPRQAWAELSGLFADTKTPTGLAVFQSPTNPEYPGDWIQYPEINWFQPTFPRAGTRYPLRKDRPLVLRYRLWVHPGRGDNSTLTELWTAYAHPLVVTRKS